MLQQVSPEVFTLRTPDELAAALPEAGFADVAVHSAGDGKTHLIAATRPETASG